MNPVAPSEPLLTWRPAVLEDVRAIVAMQDACFEVDASYREVDWEVAERFESPMLGTDSDTLLGITDDGTIAVSLWCYLLPNPHETWKVYDDNHVHPNFRTPDLTSFALDWWMARAKERVAASGIVLPIEYHQNVYPAQVDHISLLEARGFAPAIHFDELSRDLSEPIPDLPVPDGLRLVPHDAVPPADALALRNEAFGDHRGSQPWTMEMWQTRGGESSLPDASFAIMDGDRPVAYAFCEAFPHDAADRGYTEGWVMGVGTAKSHRGRGLASIVICEAMKVFAAEGLDYATLGVDTENPTGAAGLYERLGFKRMRGHIEYTKIVDPEGDSAHDG